MSTSAMQVFDGFWACVRIRDFDGIRKLADPSFRLSLPGMPPLALEEAIGAARSWRDGFSDFGEDQSVVEGFSSADGLKWAGSIHETLTHDGDFHTPGGTLAPTGRTVALDSNHIFTITPKGLMAHWYIQFDATGMAAQLA